MWLSSWKGVLIFIQAVKTEHTCRGERVVKQRENEFSPAYSGAEVPPKRKCTGVCRMYV